MTYDQISTSFLDFFQARGHKIVPSAPIVLKHDPSLMFTNAGMNQFKDYFLGHNTPPHVRVADVQRCLRVSGKHNDLEEVGRDTYHHTMFEMLGNWSFGDYFKEEAIAWAWELLTEVYNIPPQRLYVTIFSGDKRLSLEKDTESARLWRRFVPAARLLEGSVADNFWDTGSVGPCGPCSEIHIDLREDKARTRIPGAQLVNTGHPEVIELWNLVFMQYKRHSDQSLEPLKAKHVDTGMGMERLAMVLQHKKSVYDTDIFAALLAHVAKHTGLNYGEDAQQDMAFRVVVDHVRAIACTLADGQLPSAVGAGYVIRRILRRALRYAHTFLGCKTPFLHTLVPVFARSYDPSYEALHVQIAHICRIVEQEEQAFLLTLERGLQHLSLLTKGMKKAESIAGKDAFELYDTYGFPFDLTCLIAKEKGFRVDEEGYQQALDVQKKRSKKAAATNTQDWISLSPQKESLFVGYDTLKTSTTLTSYRQEKKGYQVVLTETPFYPEGGGQIGDTGVLLVGTERIPVADTQKENERIVHYIPHLPAEPSASLEALVDVPVRLATQCHHTATHLLHAALRHVLGTHVQQRGSYVSDKLLRFDFSHYGKLEKAQERAIEHLVNEKIRASIPLREARKVPFAEAKKRGAMALFGEKYGEYVRVITFDEHFSVELCGGTHAPTTGALGFFKIISQRAVSAGVRRVEAVCAGSAYDYVAGLEDTLEGIKTRLKHPKDLSAAITRVMDTQQRLEKQVAAYEQKELQDTMKALAKKKRVIHGISVIIGDAGVATAQQLRTLAFQYGRTYPRLIAVLGAVIEKSVHFVVYIDKTLVREKNLRADVLCKEWAKDIHGGGGGQDFFASASGDYIAELLTVLGKAERWAETLQMPEILALASEHSKDIQPLENGYVLVKEVKVLNVPVMHKLAHQLGKARSGLIAVLGAVIEKRVSFVVYIDKELAHKKDLQVDLPYREWAQDIHGDGDWTASLFNAVGNNLQGLPIVLEKAQKWAIATLKP